jgi:hypothetical protein
MRIIPLDDYNCRIGGGGGGKNGTVTTTFAHLALRNGWKIIEVYETEDLHARQDMEKRG